MVDQSFGLLVRFGIAEACLFVSNITSFLPWINLCKIFHKFLATDVPPLPAPILAMVAAAEMDTSPRSMASTSAGVP